MTRADEITLRWAEARPKFADSFHADHYEIVRTERVPDGYGGTTTTESVVEDGRCALDVTGRLGSEAIRGGVMTATSPYSAELPIDTTLTEADTLMINGRSFEVVSVMRGGEHELFTVAALEEVGA